MDSVHQHEVQKIEDLEMEDLKKLIDIEALTKFRENALNPEHPVTRGTAQNPDIFFQAKEAVNKFYEPIPDIVNSYMTEINKTYRKRIQTIYLLWCS